MSIAFNSVILAGYLTRDVELRYTPSGQAVGNCALAVNKKWRDQDGQERSEVLFIDFVAWGAGAEALGQYLKKGSPLLINGTLKMDQWEDKQTGQKRSKIVVNVSHFTFLGDGSQNAGDSSAQRPASKPEGPRRGQGAGFNRAPARGQASAENPQPDAADDIPF